LNKNLYGEKIRVNFIKKIRNEMKFKTPDDLSQQIKKDLEKAKDYFSNQGNSYKTLTNHFTKETIIK